MKRSILASLAVISGLLASASSVDAAPMLLLDYKASNYNATTGVWTDSSGNNDNATAAVSQVPTLGTGLTPNGSSAVVFTGGQILNIATPVSESPSGNGFTVFAFEKSNGDGGSKTIVSGGGTGGSFQYRIGGDSNGEVQELLRQGQANLGHSNTVLTSGFHTIDVAANSSGAAFRLDGTGDGTASGSSFGSISAIGSANGGEYFSGAIAEIRVYAGILSTSDITSIEHAFTQAYITQTPEPSTFILGGLGAVGLLLAARRRRKA